MIYSKLKRTMVLGASGFLGRYVASEYKETACLHSRTARVNSISDYISEFETESDVIRLFKENNFSTVINCIALADLEECETNPEAAFWLNQTLPGLLAKYSAKNDKKIVHISTDAVFNLNNKFAKENDAKNPQSSYARSKLGGEHLVIQEAKDFCIIRVNFYGKSPSQKGILEFFYHNLNSEREVVGYSDVFFTPLYARDTAVLIKAISESENTGVFHVAGIERLSKSDFGRKIAIAMQKDENLITPMDFSTSPLGVDRTRELSLDTSKVRTLGYPIPALDSGVGRAIMELRNE